MAGSARGKSEVNTVSNCLLKHLCRRLKTISNAGLWVIVQTRFMPCLYFYSSLKINIIHQLMLTYQDLPPWNQETV